MRVTGLFAGIGGLELGLEQTGQFKTDLVCEVWDEAQATLSRNFGIPLDEIAGDVSGLKSLPAGTELVTAGFPCTDLSQAGRTAGITGEASGLVGHVFRLLRKAKRSGDLPTWLLIENVPNMLSLDRGEAMRYLVSEIESLGMRWAYRTVDSRFTGVPQRRRRVLLVASATENPVDVLFAEDAGERPATDFADDAFGFYWTEGRTGVGWAVDAVPTVKGGSTVGIPSPPAIWTPGESIERLFVTPTIEDAEALQGFDRGWTSNSESTKRNGPRWKLVGNAVTVGVAKWVGEQLANPKSSIVVSERWDGNRSWPGAATGVDGEVWKIEASEFPRHLPYQHLLDVVDISEARPLSARASAGFWNRLSRGNLAQFEGFRDDIEHYVEWSASELALTR